MDYRYCNMLTVLYVVMFYGSGIPILYPCAAAFYAVTYWCDKFLLFRYYKKPVNYDSFLAQHTADWYKWALFLHMIGGVFMLSNSSILPSIDDEQVTKYKEYGKAVGLGKYSEYITAQMFVYVATYLIILIIYLLWNIVINRIVNACKYMERFVKMRQEREKVEGDFYTCVNFRTLRLELQDT